MFGRNLFQTNGEDLEDQRCLVCLLVLFPEAGC